MIYLLLFKHLSKDKRDWLTRNALAVAPLAWVYDSSIEGALPVRLDKNSLKDLQEHISIASLHAIHEIEERIKTNSLRGTAKELSKHKLKVILNASNNLKVIEFTRDLLEILGEEIGGSASEPEFNHKKNQLGIDEKAVEDYILRLAKKPSIH